jgi:two-component sensor histidine kinase
MDAGAGGANCFIVFCGHKIQRVFDNLLHNAVLYSCPDTEIAITAEVRGSNAVICFRNHGDTIPEEKIAHIFEQLYRLDAARSSSGGAGLGLAIARQIVELHGGAIEAGSAKDMIEFTVKLPLS